MGAGGKIIQENCLSSAVVLFGSKVTAKRPTLVAGSWKDVPTGCSVQSGGDWAARWNKVGTTDGMMPRSYTKGPLGGGDCAENRKIRTKEECVVAIESLGLKSQYHPTTSLWTGDSGGIPGFCTWGEYYSAHFNTRSSGIPRDDLHAICRAPPMYTPVTANNHTCGGPPGRDGKKGDTGMDARTVRVFM